MSELQILQWCLGIMGSLFVAIVVAGSWILYRLRQLKDVIVEQRAHSTQIRNLVTAQAMAQVKLETVEETLERLSKKVDTLSAFVMEKL